MNKRTSIVFPVFSRYEVRVIFARDIAATARRLNVDGSGARGICLSEPGLSRIIFETKPDEATVAHESSHAIRAMLEHAGAALDDEVFAYHLDFLVGKIHQYLKRAK